MLFAALLAGCGGSSSDSDDVRMPTPPPSTTQWTVDAGSLKLSVDESPWRLRFFDGDGQLLLEEHGGTGPGPLGTLGFHLGPPPAGAGLLPLIPLPVMDQPQAPRERETGWAHATRLLSARREGEAWIGELETNDPGGRRLTLRVEPQGDGVLVFQARPSSVAGIQAMGIGFAAHADERYFGFGERGNAVNQRGRAVEHYVGEGPYQDLEYPFVTALVPKWGIRWRKDATYFPIPWLLSSRGYGVLLDNDPLAYHRLTAADGWSLETEDTELRFRVFAGPSPADALRRYTAATGRQPRDYAPWFFGPWVQPVPDTRIGELRAADVPTSVAATYLHYLPCGDQQGIEAQQPERVARLNAEGVAVHTYFNPMICTSYQPVYDQAVRAGVLMKDRLGQPYVYPYTGSTVFNVSQFDFTAPGASAFYANLAREAIGHGYEGWMEDFGEYTPLDAVAHDGGTGTALHNRYVRDYHCGIFTGLADVARPLARFVRSGWTGSVACSPIVWGGDPTTNFGFDGLESSVYQALSMGTSGVGIWGSDIGGFFALGQTRLTDENLDRWLQFGAFSTVMRTQANGFAVPNKTRPQIWDATHLPLWRRYAKLRTQLWPYVQAAVEAYYASGLPVMRHHVLTHPEDAQAVARDDQYLFGPDFLVAPVLREGQRERELYLPAGLWVDWWRSVEYREADGSFHLKAVQPLQGGGDVTLPAPLEEIPLLLRAGTLLALLPPEVQTLAEHGGPSVVRAADRADRLRILAFPRGTSSARFYTDDSLHSTEAAGEWRLQINGTRTRTVEVEASLATLQQPFTPCSVTVSGGELLEWNHTAASRVFYARLRVGNGVLTARGC
jgi:alpha-glucosidase